MCLVKLCIGLLISSCAVFLAAADTRYECIVNLMGRGEGGFGGFEADEFENEMGEMDDADEGGFGIGGWRATGSLTCPQGNRGHILVKRVAYGTSMFGSTCRSDGFCKEEYDTADSVATRCDGKSSCFIDMLRPVFLKCGRTSTYMLVEYECTDSWTTFDVCATLSTVARGSSVFLTSPGYLTSTNRKVTTGRQMCECILQSQNGADIYMDYLQTQMSSEGESCPYEYAMIESKKNISASTIDKEFEVCGRRHVGARWLKGSIRLTYASGGQMQKRGLIAKFTVDNVGTAPRIELECGPVDASRLTLKERPASATPGPQGPPPMFPPFPPYPSLNPMMMGIDFSKVMAAYNPGGAFPGFGLSGNGTASIFPNSGPPATVQTDFTNWKINLPGTNNPPAAPSPKAPAKVPKAPQKPAQAKPGPKGPPRRGNRRPGGRRGPGKKNRAGKVVDDGGMATSDDETKKVTTAAKGNGSLVGLVFGGIGAVLILGSVGILAIHNYRKRQRIKREEAEYYYGRSASSTYGQGWKKGDEEYESVYATVAEVETYRQGCVNPAVDKTDEEESAFVNPVTNEESVKGKGKGKGKKSTGKSVYDDPEVKPSCSTAEVVSKPEPIKEKKIAVIEVHRVPEEYHTVTYGNDLHVDGCLAGNSYTSVNKAGDERNRCDECNLARPPRRRDSDYDNNIGVKKNLK